LAAGFFLAAPTLAATSGQAVGDAAPTLFTIVGTAAQPSAQDPQQVFPIHVDEKAAFDAVFNGGLWISNPQGGRIYAKYAHHIQHPDGTWTWIGTVQTKYGPQSVVLTFGDDAVFGYIPQPDGSYPLRLATTHGQTSALVTSAKALARSTEWLRLNSHPDYQVPPRSTDKAATTQAAAAAAKPASASSPVTIDLMVVYTPGLVKAYGSKTAVLTRIQYLVDLANQAYAASKVYQNLRLVHTVEVNYPDNTSDGTALNDLTDGKNGFESIPSLRTQYGADLVSLIRPLDAASGGSVAWLNGSGGTQLDAHWGFSSISDLSDGTATGSRFTDHTFVHEVGHNMGNDHDRANAGGDGGAYPYSYGYSTPSSSGFHTIMAYIVAGQTPIAVFSNPNISTCQNSPCGVPDNAANSADNAHSMNNTAPVIAAFEATKVGTVSPAHFMFSKNDVNGDGKSDLLWMNAQAGSFGYWTMSGAHVQRRWSTAVTKGYHVVATGDYNGDGKVDLVWTSAARDLYLWESNGTAFTSHYIKTYPAGWQVVGAGDVDGNGKSDLLWFDSAAHTYGYWIMDGPRYVRGRTIPVTSGWHIAAQGDFNRDGKTDLVWQGPAGSDLYLWATGASGYTSLDMGKVDSSQKLVGAAYVAGVNDEDVPKLLFLDSQAHYFYYYNVYVNAANAGAGLHDPWSIAVAPGYSIAGVGDFNGDGWTDLIWTSAARDLYLWASNGNTFDSTYIGTYPAGWGLIPSQLMAWSVSR
jgi:hypothetical protein